MLVETEKTLKLLNVKVGRREFATLMRNITTPREFIGNPEIWDLGNHSSSQRLF